MAVLRTARTAEVRKTRPRPAGAAQALLEALSPARQVRHLSSRLLLVHGRNDPAIPFTESLRLAAAADPRQTRLVLVNLVGHVEGLVPTWQQAGDLVRLWSAVYEIFRG